MKTIKEMKYNKIEDELREMEKHLSKATWMINQVRNLIRCRIGDST